MFYLKVAPEDARDGRCVAALREWPCSWARCGAHIAVRHALRGGLCRFTRAKAWGVAVGGALLTPVCLTILTLQQVNVLPKS